MRSEILFIWKSNKGSTLWKNGNPITVLSVPWTPIRVKEMFVTQLFFFKSTARTRWLSLFLHFCFTARHVFFSMSLKRQLPYLQHERIIVCILIFYALAYTELHMRLTTRFYTFIFSGTVNEANQVQIWRAANKRDRHTSTGKAVSMS